MCSIPTPPSKTVTCGRCGKVANPSDSWVHGWPLLGRIEIGIHSVAGAFLTQGRCPIPTHDALTYYGAQFVRFEWGLGTKRDGHEYRNPDFRMCANCQEELLAVLGRFFGLDQGPYCFDYQWWLDSDKYPGLGPFDDEESARDAAAAYDSAAHV